MADTNIIQRLRGGWGRVRRTLDAPYAQMWFRAGYNAAIREVKTNGMPTSGQTADDTFKRWIETGKL